MKVSKAIKVIKRFNELQDWKRQSEGNVKIYFNQTEYNYLRDKYKKTLSR